MKSLIPSNWAVPSKFRSRLGESAGRQRQMADEGHLLLVLHAVPAAGETAVEPRLFWRDKQGGWRSSSKGAGVAALRTHLQEFEDAVESQERRLSVARLAQEYFDVLRTSTPMLRTARNLHRTLQEAREACDDRELINLRDRAGDVERALELLVSESRDGLDYTAARQAEDQAAVSLELARQSHKLNVITAVFLPITALASVFSMTLHSGLEGLAAPWVFWGVVAAGVSLGLVLRARLGRPAGRQEASTAN
jgi:CorA-like Mg2+ transporter protein